MNILQDQYGYMYIYIGKFLRELTLEDIKDLDLLEDIKEKFNYTQFVKAYKNEV
ncbi:hypothetical protein IRP63_13985 (plasmid) [Clostridium botulinum]|nr:hypothetical protein [Clostridium botulinum]MCD3232602.1 hypothetical protein [Clostridium botulinum D/C]MCD3266011.1 hypothetical protein [Clostridium botulinum D/C]MCD3313000.1 hypothetical protein [Clostridium botulinum D/C]MCD3316168.1 hypothetical protein [Clostridium botulinum D/C]MCD3319755.1 hypothetical protein [Clostridium botulinum D/C]